MKKKFMLKAILATTLLCLCLGQAVQAENAALDAKYKQAVQYNLKGQTGLALSTYQDILNADPNYYQAYNNIGYIYLNKGQTDLAIDNYKKAISINPQDDTAHTNLACAYQKKQMFDNAIDEYQKALEIDPGSITVELALEKLLKEKASYEGKSYDAVEQEMLAKYPPQQTEPSYNKYLDLLNDQYDELTCGDKDKEDEEDHMINNTNVSEEQDEDHEEDHRINNTTVAEEQDEDHDEDHRAPVLRPAIKPNSNNDGYLMLMKKD